MYQSLSTFEIESDPNLFKSGFAHGMPNAFFVLSIKQQESATADISRCGFDNGECERGGDGGVHGVSTVLQDIRTHL